MTALEIIIVILLGYLLGSIPFGLLIGRLNAVKDVRQHGSGRIGMTNVTRSAGLKAGLAVGVLDVAKGALSVFLAGLITGTGAVAFGGYQFGAAEAMALAGLAAVAGHIWPVFLKFHGGRGVAVFFGGLLVFNPLAALIAGIVGVSTLKISRYVSLASIVCMATVYVVTAIFFFFNGVSFAQLGYTLVGGVTVIIVHHDNIHRLVTGQERRLGKKAAKN
jgi:acyl phosphate:glycerol-3-phosphate acyltransferase